MLVEAASRQRADMPFSGLIYASPLHISIGTCIKNLEIIAKAGKLEDIANKVEFLPL
ncbi:MAG: hypothetical protein Q8K51_01020 [Nitrospirota bacterium]|nr:hypothetical protein [Nitrospirota bacterium]